MLRMVGVLLSHLLSACSSHLPCGFSTRIFEEFYETTLLAQHLCLIFLVKLLENFKGAALRISLRVNRIIDSIDLLHCHEES